MRHWLVELDGGKELSLPKTRFSRNHAHLSRRIPGRAAAWAQRSPPTPLSSGNGVTSAPAIGDSIGGNPR
jgi:hypothetical protein